jgi:hypothetical protein
LPQTLSKPTTPFAAAIAVGIADGEPTRTTPDGAPAGPTHAPTPPVPIDRTTVPASFCGHARVFSSNIEKAVDRSGHASQNMKEKDEKQNCSYKVNTPSSTSRHVHSIHSIHSIVGTGSYTTSSTNMYFMYPHSLTRPKYLKHNQIRNKA